MAQRQVVEVQCNRCERKEYREPPQDMTPTGEFKRPAFDSMIIDEKGEATMQKFDDLCTPCLNTIKGHLAQIAKKIEGVSPMRGKREKGEKHPLQEVLDKKTAERAAKANGTGAKEKGHANA